MRNNGVGVNKERDEIKENANDEKPRNNRNNSLLWNDSCKIRTTIINIMAKKRSTSPNSKQSKPHRSKLHQM